MFLACRLLSLTSFFATPTNSSSSSLPPATSTRSRRSRMDPSASSPSLAGPSRQRQSTRGAASARKPYARPRIDIGGVGDDSNASITSMTTTPTSRRKTLFIDGHSPASTASPSGSPAAPTLQRSQSTSLFSSLTRAISRPLNWISTPVRSQQRQQPALPQSASSTSLAELAAARRSASRRTSGGLPPLAPPPSLSRLRNVTKPADVDIESQDKFGHSDNLQLRWMCGENERKSNTARDAGGVRASSCGVPKGILIYHKSENVGKRTTRNFK